jgi:hypothetical protein
MPIGVGVAGAAAGIGSAFLGAKASKNAAHAQEKASQAGIDEQRREYDLARADLAPYRAAGGTAITSGLAMLQPGYDFTASPGYQYRLDQGLRGVENSAAAKGILQSGGTLKGIDREAQGLAAQDYNDQFNRMMSIASGGQQAATSTGQFGMETGRSIADLLTQAGNAKASGYIGSANAISQGIGNVFSSIAGIPGIGG